MDSVEFLLEIKLPRLRFGRAFDLCNQEVYDHQRRIAQDRGMRTTLSMVVVTGNGMNIAHTGDCCVYLVRNGPNEKQVVQQS